MFIANQAKHLMQFVMLSQQQRSCCLQLHPSKTHYWSFMVLTSIIDDHIFGSEKSFRSEYGSGENNTDLRARLSTMYKRTLRRDVKEYINYTNRLPLTQKFDSTDAEYELYRAISDFLRRNDIYSVPAQQKKLTTMIIRKILASSTFCSYKYIDQYKIVLKRCSKRHLCSYLQQRI